ncbi:MULTISPECIES: hypothetical protein [unclassified Burkholderia]|uniref:hypothetical protein n=1 Tax=unclassified Burkholderia TaxID=2613784 RepID=UPI00142465DA|nr:MULTISPECIES: hypothetical protein [unclassified Burkholderia]NIE55308.1 hypothetical protein [Burkholderia sp. Ap-955]NIF11941.1 hypothetical protein [Burkholderia sp. Ax-1735]NIG05652.1 hypothetical protein [Burkholderia sp. Tr-849]
MADALRALLRERAEVLAFAMRMADERDRPRPDASDFALTAAAGCVTAACVMMPALVVALATRLALGA